MVATLIIDSEGVRGAFDMFDVRSLDDKGAVLSGPLFLEVGEHLRLRLDGHKDKIEVEARVQSVVPAEDTMTIVFLKPEPKLKSLLASL